MAKLKTISLVLGACGLTAFWVPEIWNYGYLQVILGQLSAFIVGVSLTLKGDR